MKNYEQILKFIKVSENAASEFKDTGTETHMFITGIINDVEKEMLATLDQTADPFELSLIKQNLLKYTVRTSKLDKALKSALELTRQQIAEQALKLN